LFFLLLFVLRLPAEIAAIHRAALPQETAILAAMDDAQALEPYVSSWTPKWQYVIARDEVQKRLERDLGFLALARKSHPENDELALLTGLVAHYAYNVDVENSHNLATSALDQAAKLQPQDVRPAWFRAALDCQTNTPEIGAKVFLSIEAAHDWQQLPAGFWRDDLACDVMTAMPAHALRAAAHLDELHAPSSPARDSYTEIAHKRFDPTDEKKEYNWKEAWRTGLIGKDLELVSTSCGVRLRARGDWAMNGLNLNHGQCLVYLGSGPFKAKEGKLSPGIVFIARRPKPGETLVDALKTYEKNPSLFEPLPVSHCPAASCLSVIGRQPGMYGKNGDGRARLVLFERDEPAFPSLLFEVPSGLEPPKDKAGYVYYHPTQTMHRMPGKLFYIVMLDTAESIEAPAAADFEFFLEHIEVE
jgi:hypothetical protein